MNKGQWFIEWFENCQSQQAVKICFNKEILYESGTRRWYHGTIFWLWTQFLEHFVNCTYFRGISCMMYDSCMFLHVCVLDPLLYTVQCAILHIFFPKYFSAEKTSIRCGTACQKLDTFVNLVAFILYLNHLWREVSAFYPLSKSPLWSCAFLSFI